MVVVVVMCGPSWLCVGAVVDDIVLAGLLERRAVAAHEAADVVVLRVLAGRAAAPVRIGLFPGPTGDLVDTGSKTKLFSF